MPEEFNTEEFNTEEFIIAGWMEYGPHRDEVLRHFNVCAAASRDEPGCRDYTVCADPAHPGRVVVFERWAGQDDLVEHFRTPHITAFREAIAPYPRSGRSLYRYFVARAEEFQSSSAAAG
jgi:quinol monooxygenase YgiN